MRPEAPAALIFRRASSSLPDWNGNLGLIRGAFESLWAVQARLDAQSRRAGAQNVSDDRTGRDKESRHE